MKNSFQQKVYRSLEHSAQSSAAAAVKAAVKGEKAREVVVIGLVVWYQLMLLVIPPPLHTIWRIDIKNPAPGVGTFRSNIVSALCKKKKG